MQNAVQRVGFGRPREAEVGVKPFEVNLCRQLDLHVTKSSRNKVEGLLHQPVTKAGSAVCRRGDDTPDLRGRAGFARRESAQVAREATVRTHGKQMLGNLIASIDIQIRASLLNDEYLAAQSQQRIELVSAELLKAAPGMALRRFDYPHFISGCADEVTGETGQCLVYDPG